MSPWKVILATLVIFCSGLATGALMVKSFTRSDRHRTAVNNPSASPNASAPAQQQQKDFLRRIDRELKLTSEQYQRIEKILKESQERTKHIREKIAPELKDEVKKVREQMRLELSPDQQTRFDEVIKVKPVKKADKGDDSGEERRRKQQKEGARKDTTNAVDSR